mmetsp:Transcript_17781/g.25030  ORF Transcript_17781/g.25030 Transcript_17781/m.25030 type:complete len:409 (-) Transcript_17781:7-1233(-)
MQKGVGYPTGWYDASLILVGRKDEISDSNSLNLLNWSEPFDSIVWCAIIATIFMSGLLYMMLEKLSVDGKDTTSYSRGMFESFMLFTQDFRFEPKSKSARLFSTSMAFWSMIIISTYTANLAKLFVLRNTPTVTITTFDEAIKADMRVCVWESANSAIFALKEHPKGKYIFKLSQHDMLLAIHDNECDFALLSLQSWLQLEQDKEVNGDCDLVWIGRVVKSMSAGFALKSDAGTLCTNLIYDVLNIHLVEMTAEGFIDQAVEKSNMATADVDCSNTDGLSQDDLDPKRMSIDDMAGTFLLHIIAAIVALVVTAISSWRLKEGETTTAKLEREQEISDSVSYFPLSIGGYEGNDEEIKELLTEILDRVKVLQSEHSEQKGQTMKMISLFEQSIQDSSIVGSIRTQTNKA